MVHTRTKIVAGITGAILVVCLVVFIGFQYMLIGYKADLIVQEKKILDAKTQESRLASIEHLVSETASQRSQLTSLILTEESVVDFLALIETLGAEQGVTLETQSLDVVPANDQFEELRMSLVAQGGEKNVLNILHLLETLPYQSSVDKITLSRVSGDNKAGIWQGSFELRVTKYTKK